MKFGIRFEQRRRHQISTVNISLRNTNTKRDHFELDLFDLATSSIGFDKKSDYSVAKKKKNIYSSANRI